MSEQSHPQFGPDELFLQGRLQVDAAISVLAMTDVNPQAEATLTALRNLHELESTQGAKRDLGVYLNGESAASMKADIIVSATMASENENLPPEMSIAARGLLDVLVSDKQQDV